MSPEQVSGDPAAVDSRTDVYSLGVILFLLLGDRLPFDLSGKTLGEAIATVQRGDMPRLRAVAPDVDPDLDAICARALDADKARRYPSAAELAADVRRFLHDEPIVARPPSTAYQLRKLARRHRGAFYGVMATTAAIVVGLVAVTALLIGEREARRELQRSYAVTREVVHFLSEVLEHPDEQADESVSLLSALQRGARLLAQPSAWQPQSIGWIHSILGESFVAMNQSVAGERHLEESLRLLGDSPEHDAGAIRTLSTLASSQAGRGQRAAAIESSTRAVARARAAPGDGGRDLLRAVLHHCSVLRVVGDLDGAEETAREFHTLLEALDADADERARQRGLVARMLGEIAMERARHEEAARHLAESLAELERAGISQTDDYADTLDAYAKSLAAMRDPSALEVARDALSLTRRIHGRAHRDTIAAHQTVAVALMRGDDMSGFLDSMREAAAIAREVWPDPHPSRVAVEANLAEAALSVGEIDEARRVGERALADGEFVFDGPDPALSNCAVVLARVYLKQGEIGLARDSIRRAIDINLATVGEAHLHTILSYHILAQVERAAHDVDAEIRALRGALRAASADGKQRSPPGGRHAIVADPRAGAERGRPVGRRGRAAAGR